VKGGGASFNVNSGDSKTKFKNDIYGAEIRKRLLGGGLSGAVLPDLSVSLGYDWAKGSLTRTEGYNGALLGGGTLDANTTMKSDWKVGAVTARAVVSKKFLIITPFAGVGVSRLGGTTNTTVGIDGTETPGPVNVNQSVTGSAKNNKTIGHALGGLELSPLPFCNIGVGGLIAKDFWAASLDLRVQFP